MKILFLCGSLENGRDGVGDYSRRLAGEILRLGHDVKIISLNEKHLKETIEEIQSTGQELIPVLRLSSNVSWDNRIEMAKTFIKTFDPEWISLQYVPFAYEDRGLTFGLSKKILKLRMERKFHIMFHELWLGIDKESLLKMKFWGGVQKRLILQMIKTVAPDKIHTQSQVYKSVLNDNRVKADLLRLFSNIPFAEVESQKNENQFNCVLFGNIHPGPRIEDFISELKEYCKNVSRQLIFTFIGRNGSEIENWILPLERKGIQYRNIGECSTESISSFLNESDLGVSTTPYYLAEKSGTLAAMLERKLPVVCVANSWTPKLNGALPTIENIYNYSEGNLNSFLISPKNYSVSNNLENIAVQFIEDIT